MGQALYRQYRPKSLEEVIGQEPITQTLSRAVATDQISHAYLFTGPRGVGKTSVARILAHAINKLDYTDDSTAIDIIEIDAASNRRIDEIRELREKAYVSPASAKYKVYIIDEVHMLTREAFNALLKLLEEPPRHVVFILATTDAHKLPATIISRTQRYPFRPIQTEDTIKALGNIAKKEKIEIDNQSLKLIAEHSQGSLRDATSLLDQARNYADHNVITTDAISDLLGLPPTQALSALLSFMIQGGEASRLVRQLSDLYDQGYQASLIAKELGSELRNELIKKSSNLEASKALNLLSDLLDVLSSESPDRYLEIVLLKNLDYSQQTPLKAPSTPEPVQSEKLEQQTENVELEIVEIKEEKPKAAKTKTKTLDLNDQLWSSILSSLKKQHNTLYGVARMAEPSLDKDGKLMLGFAFEFHRKRISDATNGKKLTNIIQDVTGHDVIIECYIKKDARPPVYDGSNPQSEKEVPAPDNQDISNISSIFNDAEVIES
jgi:DNA polymerase-3 subunit gamma/tau